MQKEIHSYFIFLSSPEDMLTGFRERERRERRRETSM